MRVQDLRDLGVVDPGRPVRMDPECRHHEAGMTLGARQDSIGVGPVLGHREHRLDPGLPGPVDHLLAVPVELGGMEMAVGVEERDHGASGGNGQSSPLAVDPWAGGRHPSPMSRSTPPPRPGSSDPSPYRLDGGIGLLLAGGGPVGHAYEAAVVAALAEHVGWDAREADLVVGTSAGSQVAALLRAGLSPEDLASRAAGRTLSSSGAPIANAFQRPSDRPSFSVLGYRPTSGRYLLRTLRAPGRARLGLVLSSVAPVGTVSLLPMRDRLNERFGGGWSDRPLWICVADLDRARRFALGRAGAPRVDVGTAVAASSAVPGWFRPVEVGDHRFVDGGVYSSSNLDVLAGGGLDLVVAVSPLSAEDPFAIRRADVTYRRAIRKTLHREADRVRRSGTEVVLVEPSIDEAYAMGMNPMDVSRGAHVVERTLDSMSRRLTGPLGERLAALRASAPPLRAAAG